MQLSELIRARLSSLDAVSLDIIDDSHRHAGHAQAGDGGHFRLHIVSSAFSGQSSMARHRLIYGLLGDLIPARIHALSIQARSPEEAA